MIAAVVQARMGSRRLPGKVLRPLRGRPALAYLIERLERSAEIDALVVATSSTPADDPIAAFCADAGVRCHRGPLEDVAGRFLAVCDELGLSAFVRVSADSPLLDQRLVDRGVRLFRTGGAEVVTNVSPRTFPAGQSLEIVSAAALRRSVAETDDAEDREHVTPFLYRQPDRFRIASFAAERTAPGPSLALDAAADAQRIESILALMDRPHWDYSCAEVVELSHRVEASGGGRGGRTAPRGLTTVQVGIIGLGVGEAHIDGYRAHPGAEVVALCDSDPVKLGEVAARHPGLRTSTDAGELLDDPGLDAVSIASYDSFQYEQTRRALEQGKHVFVEKPLCRTEEEVAELRRLLDERPDLRLSTNLPLRLSPRFTSLRAAIAAGKLGRVHYLEGDYRYGRLWKLTDGWRGDEEDYSVVLGGAVHLVDLLLWLTGDEVLEVSAAGNGIATEGTKFRYDDLVVATLELASGAIAKISANFACVHPHFHAVKVLGTEGTFVNGLPDATLWRRGRDGERERERIDAPYPGVGKGDLIPSFVESIRVGPGSALVTAEEVLTTMDVCLAIERARATGERVGVG